jgi:hypothetical protein
MAVFGSTSKASTLCMPLPGGTENARAARISAVPTRSTRSPCGLLAQRPQPGGCRYAPASGGAQAAGTYLRSTSSPHILPGTLVPQIVSRSSVDTMHSYQKMQRRRGSAGTTFSARVSKQADRCNRPLLDAASQPAHAPMAARGPHIRWPRLSVIVTDQIKRLLSRFRQVDRR